MSTYREIIYMVLDELKVSSDDAYFTEDHIIYLCDKIRALVLKQRYADVKRQIPESNYQTLCLDLIQVPNLPKGFCTPSMYLRSKDKIPFLIPVGSPKVSPMNYYSNEFALISRDRMKYVGNNNYLQNIIYCTIGTDSYLYFKSSNLQHLYLEKVKFTGIFESPSIVSELDCEEGAICELLDRKYPLEEGLVASVIELIVKTLTSSIYKPGDSTNNASDDMSTLAAFLRRNMKTNFQKQIEE